MHQLLSTWLSGLYINRIFQPAGICPWYLPYLPYLQITGTLYKQGLLERYSHYVNSYFDKVSLNFALSKYKRFIYTRVFWMQFFKMLSK